MDKRYQVFVSSTYADLREERSKVIQALMEMDCIPSGMELFPAADEEQWRFIQRVIDDCDYYLLIIGGRYGSTTPEGISYTEKEYDYARERGLKILAFIRETIDDLPEAKTDSDAESRARLLEFRKSVATGRLVKHWNLASDLPGLVALSLQKTIKTYPAVGWIRANEARTPEELRELNELRKQNEVLRGRVRELESQYAPRIDDIAGLDETIKLSGQCWVTSWESYRPWSVTLTWLKLFALISPFLDTNPNEVTARDRIAEALFKYSSSSGSSPNLDDQDLQTVKIQLSALNLVSVSYLQTVAGGMAWFWQLSNSGRKLMIELRAIRTSKGRSTP